MKKNYLINLDMENNATIDDYYEELMHYKKLGVLARAKYKGEYVYTNEYSIKNKLYELELKNNLIFQENYKIIKKYIYKNKSYDSYLIPKLVIENKNLNYLLYIIKLINYVKDKRSLEIEEYIDKLKKSVVYSNDEEALEFSIYFFLNYINYFELIKINSSKKKILNKKDK